MSLPPFGAQMAAKIDPKLPVFSNISHCFLPVSFLKWTLTKSSRRFFLFCFVFVLLGRVYWNGSEAVSPLESSVFLFFFQSALFLLRFREFVSECCVFVRERGSL